MRRRGPALEAKMAFLQFVIFCRLVFCILKLCRLFVGGCKDKSPHVELGYEKLIKVSEVRRDTGKLVGLSWHW